MFERDGRFLPSTDVVGSLAKIHLHLLQGMEAHVMGGLVDGWIERGDGNIPDVDAKRSSHVYPAYPIFPMPDSQYQYINDMTISDDVS